MYSHAPPNYTCPFCCLVHKIECAGSQLLQTDIVQQNEMATAFMATRRFPNNQGHVLVIPNQHYENIFDLPIEITPHIHQLASTIAGAMKATYNCDGILLRQHNEPAGGQHIWHYHLHIIPRYKNDDFNFSKKRPFPASKRAELARKLSTALSSN